MTNRTHNESPWAGFREVMIMSGPIILGSISYTIMQFADTIMVARLGKEALASIGSAGVWSFVMGCFILGIVGCVSTFVAQSFGREDLENCSRYAWQGLYVSILAIPLALALYPISGLLFRSMNHSELVTRYELDYFRVRLAGYVLMAWAGALAGFFQAIGRPALPMFVAIAANAANLVMNYFLIYGHGGFPRLEVAGAAMATVLSMALQVVLLMALFLSGSTSVRFQTRQRCAPDLARMRELLRIGVPAGFTILMDVANWGLFTSYVVGHFGAVALAANNAAMAFLHVSFMPALGLNHGIAAIVGQYVGRRDYDTAVARTYTAMRIAIGYMFLAGLTFGVFGRQLIAFCGLGSDAEVLELGARLLVLAAIFQGFDAVNIVCLGALRGAGDTRWVAWLIFFFNYFFFLPMAVAFAFAAGWGAAGAWAGATIYIIVLSGTLLRRFQRGRWRQIQIFTETA